MKISIVCPVYNGEKFIQKLNEMILKQKKVEIESIYYILTESNDNSEGILKSINAVYKKLSKDDFSHSLVRENAARSTKGEIIVFITQDIIITDQLWLYNLIRPIIEGEAAATFSRQVCDNNTIEKYIREKNYPDTPRIVGKADIQALGIMCFFFSDVSSAMKKDVYVKLNGYDGKDLITNEDMYIAHKAIHGGYKIKYCSASKVIHSHKFTFIQLFRRYFDTGVFLKENSYFLDYKANRSGIELLKYVTKRALQEKNIGVLLNVVPNFAARFIGNALGIRYKKLSKRIILKCTANKAYWLK